MRAYRLRGLVATAFILALSSGIALPQAVTPDPTSVAAAIEEAKIRLNLTPEQEAQLKPLLEERTAALKSIRDRHAGDDSPGARREMYREARPVLDDYQAKVRAILTDEQEAEWEKMRAEARERLKERYGDRNEPD